MNSAVLPLTQWMRETPTVLLPDWVEAAMASLSAAHDGFESLRSAAATRLREIGLPDHHSESWSLARAKDTVLALQTAYAETPSLKKSAPNSVYHPDKPLDAKTLAPFIAAIAQEDDGLGLFALATAPVLAFKQVLNQATATVTPELPKLAHTHFAYLQAGILKVEAHTETTQVLMPGVQAPAEGEIPPLPGACVHSVLYIHVGAGAKATFILSDLTGDTLSVVTRLHLRVERDATVEVYLSSRGAALNRLSLHADLLGSGIDLQVKGLAVVMGKRQAHRHVLIRHLSPDSVSQQIFRSAAGGEARVSVDGTIEVSAGAKRTVASQLLKSLLLSGSARADSKPRLRIHNDDVKCNHGATVGKLDEQQRFYLLSRGLSETQALECLTKAFVAAPLQTLSDGPLRRQIENQLFQNLAQTDAVQA